LCLSRPLAGESFQPFAISSDFAVKGVSTVDGGISVAGFLGQLVAPDRKRNGDMASTHLAEGIAGDLGGRDGFTSMASAISR